VKDLKDLKDLTDAELECSRPWNSKNLEDFKNLQDLKDLKDPKDVELEESRPSAVLFLSKREEEREGGREKERERDRERERARKKEREECGLPTNLTKSRSSPQQCQLITFVATKFTTQIFCYY